MKKLLLLLALPAFTLAQTPPVKNDNEIATEKLSSYDKAKAEAKKKIEAYRDRVAKGTSMELMAKTYSQDPGSAKNGGLYTGVYRGQMVEEFEKVAFNLKPGEVSEVFETQFGYHFIQLISDNGDTRDLRHLLIKP